MHPTVKYDFDNLDPDVAYACGWNALGDMWALINQLNYLSEKRQKPFTLSPYRIRSKEWVEGDSIIPSHDLVGDILNELYTPNSELIVKEDFDVVALLSVSDFKRPYYPTKTRWTPSPLFRRQIAVQWKTKNHKDNMPGKHDLKRFKKFCQRSGIDVIEIGLPLRLSESIAAMCDSDLFMGIDSGMSHVAHSVGIPCLLWDFEAINDQDATFRNLARFHPSKYYLAFKTMPDIVEYLRSFYRTY